MKSLFTLLLTVTLGVLAGNACAQQRMPQKVFRQLLKDPGRFPNSRLAELSNKQVDQLLTRLRNQTARVERKNEQERLRQAHVFGVSRPAVFKALSKHGTDLHALSGTLFKTTYAGKTEIFGALPMHILKNQDDVPGSLSQEFSAAVQTENGVKVIPAKIVQLSSSKTGDVALVKFRPEDESLLSPLPLTSAVHKFPKQVYAQGFAHSVLTQSSFPLVSTTSAGMLVAQIPAANVGDRSGFCGSPVLTQQATLAGIHVGSNYASKDPTQDIFFDMFKLQKPARPTSDTGYIAPADFLRKLVTAYHHPGSKLIPIRLAGQEMTRLAVDEYVSGIELLDENMQLLWSKTTNFKVTFTPAEMAIKAFPQAAFVNLLIGKTHWVQDEKGLLVQDTPFTHSVLKPLVRP